MLVIALSVAVTIFTGQCLIKIIDVRTHSFSLCCTEISSSSTDSNEGPVARTAHNLVIQLPHDIIKLDGSQSTDDGTALKYSWTKSSSSPGAGNVLDNTDTEPVMYYANAVTGNYTFTLTVEDEQGLTDSSSVNVIVQPGRIACHLL